MSYHIHRGIVVSWADYSGHAHVNKRPNAYVINLFTGLGYTLNHKLTGAARATRFRNAWAMRFQNGSWEWATTDGLHGLRSELNRTHFPHRFSVKGWFGRSALVFERITPLSGPGCTPTSEDDGLRISTGEFGLPMRSGGGEVPLGVGRVHDAVRMAHGSLRPRGD